MANYDKSNLTKTALRTSIRAVKDAMARGMMPRAAGTKEVARLKRDIAAK